MGNPKQKWTSEEEEALRAGVAKHGTGKWKNIQRDPEFNHLLHSRSNIDLKDKWRNLNIANGQGSRDKSRGQKAKANPDAPATPLPKLQAAATFTPFRSDGPVKRLKGDYSKFLFDAKTTSKPVILYNAMICEALATLKEPNGSDTSTILSFIKQRHEVPQNFRKLLSARLRRLVAQDKLEKVQNCFKIKKDAIPGLRTSPPQQKESQTKETQAISQLGHTVEEAAVAAACKVAEAENKTFVASEAVKEAERVSKMAEDTGSMLQLAKEIYEKCSRGEVVLMV